MNLGKFAVQAIKEWNPLSPEAYERRDRHKAYRKARKKQKRGEPLTEQDRQILNQTQEVDMLQGKKTYLGIATVAIGLVLGWLGVGEADAQGLTAQIVGSLDQILTVGGLAIAAYGRAKAKPAA